MSPGSRARRLSITPIGVREGPRDYVHGHASTTPVSSAAAPRSTPWSRRLPSRPRTEEQAWTRDAAAGVLDQRLQRCSRCARSSITIRSASSVFTPAAAQQHPADRRRLDEADLAGRGPHADARRHRAPHPAAGVQGAARPLRDQLRVGRLPAARRRSVPRRDRSTRSSTRRRAATWPASAASGSTATRCA